MKDAPRNDSSSVVQYSLIQKLLAAVFYGFASIVVVFVNKIVLTNYRFPSFLFLGIGQFGVVSFPRLSLDIPQRIFPLPVLHVLNLISGLGGTQRLNLPMFTVLRRFSILFTLIAESIVLKTKSSFLIKVSIALMTIGAIVAGIKSWCCLFSLSTFGAYLCSTVKPHLCQQYRDDLTFNAYGYLLVLVNNICSAASSVYVKKKLNAQDLGQYGLLYYNSLLLMMPCCAFAYWTSDFDKALAYSGWLDATFVLLFLLSCVCGFILNFASMVCTMCNSPLTTCCVGPIKNLFVTYAGMVVSGDYVYSLTNFIGINVSVLGSLFYTYITFSPAKSNGHTDSPSKKGTQII